MLVIVVISLLMMMVDFWNIPGDWWCQKTWRTPGHRTGWLIRCCRLRRGDFPAQWSQCSEVRNVQIVQCLLLRNRSWNILKLLCETGYFIVGPELPDISSTAVRQALQEEHGNQPEYDPTVEPCKKQDSSSCPVMFQQQIVLICIDNIDVTPCGHHVDIIPHESYKSWR